MNKTLNQHGVFKHTILELEGKWQCLFVNKYYNQRFIKII